MRMEPQNATFDGYDDGQAASGKPVLHFGHANGYPPGAYRLLFERLSTKYHVLAMNMRPLWPGTDPQSMRDWRPLADDLQAYLDRRNLSNLIGAGHSMGATTALRLALRQPERFRALVLIDPVLFPYWMIIPWDLIYRLGLSHQLPPLAKISMRRRNEFESREAMFANYRQKSVFSRMSDEALWAYVDSLACDCQDGGVRLCYPQDWERHLYVTGIRADLELWRNLRRLKPPVLIIRGAQSNTFWESAVRMIQSRLPGAQIHCIPDATHLVALEKPEEVSNIAMVFLRDCNQEL
jgi:pimeloyl-ACP methyl ester carboxylesterase